MEYPMKKKSMANEYPLPAAPSHDAALGHGPLQGGAKRKALRPRPGRDWKSMQNHGKSGGVLENWNNLTLSKTWGKLKETHGETIWKNDGQSERKCKLVDLPSLGRLGPGPTAGTVHHGIPCLALSQKRRRCQRPLPGIVRTSLQLRGGTERWTV